MKTIPVIMKKIAKAFYQSLTKEKYFVKEIKSELNGVSKALMEEYNSPENVCMNRNQLYSLH